MDVSWEEILRRGTRIKKGKILGRKVSGTLAASGEQRRHAQGKQIDGSKDRGKDRVLLSFNGKQREDRYELVPSLSIDISKMR